jgi:hypothetical protein
MAARAAVLQAATLQLAWAVLLQWPAFALWERDGRNDGSKLVNVAHP